MPHQPFPLETEFELVKIYRRIDSCGDIGSIKKVLKKIIRNIHINELFSDSGHEVIQKTKIKKYLSEDIDLEQSQSKEESIRLFFRSIGVPEIKINEVIPIING